MPQTKPEPLSQPAMAPPGGPPPESNNLTGEVFTLREAAAYLQLSESDVLRAVQEQGLKGRQLGQEWRFLKASIQDWLRTGPAPMSNKEAWLSLAGSCKDDPDLEGIVEEAYRKRGRPITEDGSYKNFSR